MSKDFVDGLIHNMRLANMVTKASPWMVEGMGEKQKNVRYIGMYLKDDWLDIFPLGNNLLLKFVIDRNSARIEYFLANTTPFVKIASVPFTDHDKWELLLGEFKRKLKKDKLEYQNHTEKHGNLYAYIIGKLK